MAVLRQNLTYSIRRLSRSPGLVLAVILSIGLGIAANATIFSMISRFVLRPAPVGDPATLMSLHTTHDGDRCCNSFPWPVYTDVRDQTHSFSGVAAYYELLPASIGGKGDPERVWGQSATSNFFEVSQLRMYLGRGFLASEERLPVIVLSHRLWQRRLASDPATLGNLRTLRISYSCPGPAGHNRQPRLAGPAVHLPPQRGNGPAVWVRACMDRFASCSGQRAERRGWFGPPRPASEFA